MPTPVKNLKDSPQARFGRRGGRRHSIQRENATAKPEGTEAHLNTDPGPSKSNQSGSRGVGGPSTSLANSTDLHESIISISAQNMAKEVTQAITNILLTWESVIIEEDNCFLYTGDKTSTAIFKSRMNGQTPEQFVRRQIQGHQDIDLELIDWSEDQQLVTMLLGYWAERSKEWRVKFRTKQEARDDFDRRKEHLRLLPELYERKAGRKADGKIHLGQMSVPFGPPQHVSLAHLLPTLFKGEQREDDTVAYQMLRLDVCHVECPEQPNDGVLREKLFEEHFEHDLELLVAKEVLDSMASASRVSILAE